MPWADLWMGLLIFEAEMINYLRLFLIPFSLVYGLVIWIRNKCYDFGWFKSTTFDIPLITVGNLAVGGSGKTPVTEYLVELLPQYRIAILSRGYGRRTKGFLLADATACASTIGDEPMQFYSKFPNVTVAVCEDRVEGIRRLKDSHNLVIMDDAFQHRSVKAGLNILLFEYSKLTRMQWLLPAGNLREPFSGYQRAQIVLVTKSPSTLNTVEKAKVSDKFGAPWKPLFSRLQYANLVQVFDGTSLPLSSVKADHVVFLLTGIANPLPLRQEIERHTMVVQHHVYGDHHQFTRSELQQLANRFVAHPNKNKWIITTEKDAQRLNDAGLREILLNLPVFILPIKIDILAEDKVTFDQYVINYVSSYTRDR